MGFIVGLALGLALGWAAYAILEDYYAARNRAWGAR